jgi:hypothetical protein
VNPHLHFHAVFLKGVYFDRTEVGFKPCSVTVDPPELACTMAASVTQPIAVAGWSTCSG